MSKALKRQREEFILREKEEERIRLRAHEHRLKVRVLRPEFNPVDIVANTDFSNNCLHNPRNFKSKIKSSSNERRLYEAVRYTFQKYFVPAHIEVIWSSYVPPEKYDAYPRYRYADNDDRHQIRMESWATHKVKLNVYFCVAQGGSLYKDQMKEFLTKKETHVFLTQKHGLNFEEAITFAIAKTFALNDGIAIRIAKSKLRWIKPSEFIKSVIYFFARNTPDTINEIDDLVDFIINKHREDVNFTMSGQTLESLRKKTEDWHYTLRRIKVMGSHSWSGCGLENSEYQFYEEGEQVTWKFSQITTSKELAAEGTEMRHCVYGYKDDCINGRAHIWSLSRNSREGLKKKVTIELRNNGAIVQARGKANRSVTTAERNVIRRWAADNNLYVAYL